MFEKLNIIEKFLNDHHKKISNYQQSYILNNQHLIYSFKDYLLIQGVFTGNSRKNIDTSTKVTDVYGNKVTLSIPFVSSAMKFFGNEFINSLKKIKEEKNLFILHFYPRVGVNLLEIKDILKDFKFSVSIGVNTDLRIIEELMSTNNVVFISLDIAHGAIRPAAKKILELSQLTKTGIVWGNFGSIESILYALLIFKEANIEDGYIKLGIGSGSACTTRMNAGVGMSNMLLINMYKEFFEGYDFYELRKDLELHDLDYVKTILDGGFRSYGDLNKAAVFSDLVMTGQLFISEEMEGNIYYGMASEEAKKLENKSGYVEGNKYLVREKKSLIEIVESMQQNLRSAISYVGAENLEQFRNKASVVLSRTSEEGFWK
jgi:IMP dehydrogenase